MLFSLFILKYRLRAPPAGEKEEKKQTSINK
jgi:hypothetical protein